MNLDLLTLQAVLIGGAIFVLIIGRNGWRDRRRRRREAEAIAKDADLGSTDTETFLPRP